MDKTAHLFPGNAHLLPLPEFTRVVRLAISADFHVTFPNFPAVVKRPYQVAVHSLIHYIFLTLTCCCARYSEFGINQLMRRAKITFAFAALFALMVFAVSADTDLHPLWPTAV